jgi:hypothetical protein
MKSKDNGFVLTCSDCCMSLQCPRVSHMPSEERGERVLRGVLVELQ